MSQVAPNINQQSTLAPIQPDESAASVPSITPTISIQNLADFYPQLVETLIVEYGFHCVGCFASQFETLEEGARVHGIVGGDFAELLNHLQSLVASSDIIA
jgi:hybrid cluster-associated redox disulfide protein